jgi:hypothetical protein
LIYVETGEGKGNYTFFAMSSTNTSDIRHLSWIGTPYHLDVSTSVSVICGDQWHTPIRNDDGGYGVASFNLTTGAYTVLSLSQRVQLLVASGDNELIIITTPENAGAGATLVYVAPVPVPQKYKLIGSFGSLTPLAHVRCVSAVGASPQNNRLLFVQFYDVQSLNQRPFVGIMDLSTGQVSRRNIPTSVDLDSLWYDNNSGKLYALILDDQSFYFAITSDDGTTLSFDPLPADPLNWYINHDESINSITKSHFNHCNMQYIGRLIVVLVLTVLAVTYLLHLFVIRRRSIHQVLLRLSWLQLRA